MEDTISTYPGCCGMPHLEQAQHEKVKIQSENISKELCKLIDQGYDIVTHSQLWINVKI